MGNYYPDIPGQYQNTEYNNFVTADPFHHRGPIYLREPKCYNMVPSYDIPCAFPVVSTYHRALGQEIKLSSEARSSVDWKATNPLALPAPLQERTDWTRGNQSSSHHELEPTPDLYPGKLPCEDIEMLVAKIFEEGHTKEAEKSRICAMRGKQARDLLDGLQSWLDTHPHHPFRRKILRLLVQLSSASHELPASLFVSGVSRMSCDPQNFGGFADVFYGMYHGQAVAIKRLRINAHGIAKDRLHWELCKESLVWSQLVHPNILPFIGVDREIFMKTACLALVSPWMSQGTIMSYICSAAYDPWRDRLRLFIEIAEGLKYLHDQGFAHGDLHGDNVLITDKGHACLTDFGLTVVGDLTLSRELTATRNNAGAVRWLAPEHTSDDPEVSRKRPPGDIFAFGRLCLAICTTRSPFYGQTTVSVLLGLAQDKRPPQPSEEECGGYAMSDALWSLANECWAMSPADRPRMPSLLVSLRGYLLCSNEDHERC